MRALRERKQISYAEDADEVEARQIALAKKESLESFSFGKRSSDGGDASKRSK